MPLLQALFQRVGALALTLRAAAGGLRPPRWSPGAVLSQCAELGLRTQLLVWVTVGFTGMVLVFHAALQAKRVVGDTSFVGPAFLHVLVREFAPVITGLMLAARAGAGIGAELGTMQITDQIDALRMNGADPLPYLVTPRVLAGTLMNPLLTLHGVLAGLLGGAYTAARFYDIPAAAFMNAGMLTPGDVITALVKSLCFGAVVPALAAMAGLGAHGDAAAVGVATTRAVVEASMAVIALDALLGALAFAVGL